MSTNMHNPADCRVYPDRWPRYRGKQLFEAIDDKSETGEEELLSVSHITGITPRSQKTVNMFQSESLVGYKRVQIGDIAANTMWTWQGAIGVSEYAGVVSPAYNVYRQRRDYYNPRFLDVLLREPSLVDVYHSISTGIRPSRLRLYPNEFLSIDFPVPSRAEQDQIVSFIDWKTSEINRLIKVYQRQIDILEELRSATIEQFAVRGGCNEEQSTHYSDCDIRHPQHWRELRLRELFSLRKGLTITKADLKDSGIPVISYGQIHSRANEGTRIKDELLRCVSEKYLKTNPSALVVPGDFIFADTSEDVAGSGNCIFVNECNQLFAGYHTIIAHPHDARHSRYLAYLFQAPGWRSQIQKSVNGVKVYSISQGLLKDVRILVPPAEEQLFIISRLDTYCADINARIDKINEAIRQLQALKTRLIADVITGNLDVRAIEVPAYEHADDSAVIDIDEETEFDSED